MSENGAGGDEGGRDDGGGDDLGPEGPATMVAGEEASPGTGDLARFLCEEGGIGGDDCGGLVSVANEPYRDTHHLDFVSGIRR